MKKAALAFIKKSSKSNYLSVKLITYHDFRNSVCLRLHPEPYS